MVQFLKKCADKELILKILFDILIVALFAIGSLVPMYGINRDYLAAWLNSDTLSGIDVFNLLSGNSFKSMSIFALGIAPYITASIIVQLLTIVVPKLEELQKQSQEKMEKCTYVFSVILTVIESVLTANYFYQSDLLQEKTVFYFVIVAVSMIIGTLIVLVLAKLIDKYGIGKGISIILLINIISQLPSSFQALHAVFVPEKTTLLIFSLILFISVSILLVCVICLQNAEKRIPIQQAGQTRSKQKTNYLPIKLNLSNVMPVVFTSSIFQAIMLLSNFVKNETFSYVTKFFNMSNWFDVDNMIFTLGIIPYAVLVILFAYFYTAFSFDVKTIADNLKKQNIVIVGVRPGLLTSEYLKKQLRNFVFLGAIFLIIIVLAPTAIVQFLKIPNFALAGTSILIVNSVSVDLFKEIETERITNKEVDFFA